MHGTYPWLTFIYVIHSMDLLELVKLIEFCINMATDNVIFDWPTVHRSIGFFDLQKLKPN